MIFEDVFVYFFWVEWAMHDSAEPCIDAVLSVLCTEYWIPAYSPASPFSGLIFLPSEFAIGGPWVLLFPLTPSCGFSECQGSAVYTLSSTPCAPQILLP